MGNIPGFNCTVYFSYIVSEIIGRRGSHDAQHKPTLTAFPPFLRSRSLPSSGWPSGPNWSTWVATTTTVGQLTTKGRDSMLSPMRSTTGRLTGLQLPEMLPSPDLTRKKVNHICQSYISCHAKIWNLMRLQRAVADVIFLPQVDCSQWRGVHDRVRGGRTRLPSDLQA